MWYYRTRKRPYA